MEALAMGGDSGDENQKTMWKGLFYGSAQSKAAHKNCHRIVWEAKIFTNTRDTLLVRASYAIRGLEAKEEEEDDRGL